MNLSIDRITIANLPFDESGDLCSSRIKPGRTGSGAISGYENPRTIQTQVRFSF